MRPADVCRESVRALAHNRGRTALTAVFRQVKIDKYVCRISTPSC